MFVVDTATGRIRLHRGDTGAVNFRITGYTLDSTDRVLWTMKDATGTEVIKRICTPVDNVITVDFHNEDTDYLSPGLYPYDARVAIKPEYDGQGNIINVDYDHGGAVCTPASPLYVELLGTVGQI